MALSNVSACFFSLIVLPPLLCMPSPSLFQHLCWVHARASDKPLCVPSLGSLPRFSSWLAAPPSWKPHNCLPFSCTPQSFSSLAGPLKTIRRTHVETESPQNTSTYISQGSVKQGLSERLRAKGGERAKVSSHCIMRLAILQLQGIKSKEVFIAEVWNHFL